MEVTHVRVTRDLHDRLKAIGYFGESYAEVLERIVAHYESCEARNGSKTHQESKS